jgi:hypothetical protein
MEGKMNGETDSSLREELEALGDNLKQAMASVWESEERQRLQAEIESGLEQALSVVRSEVAAFSRSETGERLRSDLKSIHKELESGEAAGQLRQDLASALRSINQELRKASEWSAGAGPDDAESKAKGTP